MNNYLYLKIKNQKDTKIAKKLLEINVPIYDLKKEQNYIYVKILSEDYKKIEKYLKTLKFLKVKYTGRKYFQQLINKYNCIFFALILSLFFIILCSNIIVDIKVIHEDPQIVELITSELEKNNIRKFTFKKSYNYLQTVKKKIKNNNSDKIDWLEIKEEGMRYVIRVEERIVNLESAGNSYCNIYSKKDALVKSIIVKQGETLINVNDYVKKGDLLISGDIHLNEEIVNTVCAEGAVQAEVWYEVNVKIPFESYETTKTGKKRHNIIINYDGIDRQIFRSRLKEYAEKRKIIFDLLGIKIYLKTEEEIIRNKIKYTEKEMLSKAVELAEQKVIISLDENAEILSKKILQKRLNNSTMDIDIFIVVQEDISHQVAMRKETQNGL